MEKCILSEQTIYLKKCDIVAMNVIYLKLRVLLQRKCCKSKGKSSIFIISLLVSSYIGMIFLKNLKSILI